ncbi:hypothetical protein B0H14DRAFT_2573565 [Mycena olivaceomarginata]|nr:hypothetical protein B0H14DRAFT_2573565 [Mycena olivaceomarginata]
MAFFPCYRLSLLWTTISGVRLLSEVDILTSEIAWSMNQNEHHEKCLNSIPTGKKNSVVPNFGSYSPLNVVISMSGGPVNPNVANSMPTELPFIILQALVHNFLHNAACLGFFLDTQVFHDAVTSSNGCTLPPVLLNVMYLWGVHLSNDARITVYEPAFLAHALRSTAGSLAGTHPRTVLHSAQASVLLAYYFLRNARALKGRYHINAAVATILNAGLHLIRGRSRPPTAEALPPPGDAVEEGERIGEFWSVLTLNNVFTSSDGAPSNVTYSSEGLTIARHGRWRRTTTSGTVKQFLANSSDETKSSVALYAKAGILFEAATRLGVRSRGNSISRSDTDLEALDHRINVFAAALPPVQSKPMLVIHTIAHGVTIIVQLCAPEGHLASRNINVRVNENTYSHFDSFALSKVTNYSYTYKAPLQLQPIYQSIYPGTREHGYLALGSLLKSIDSSPPLANPQSLARASVQCFPGYVEQSAYIFKSSTSGNRNLSACPHLFDVGSSTSLLGGREPSVAFCSDNREHFGAGRQTPMDAQTIFNPGGPTFIAILRGI